MIRLLLSLPVHLEVSDFFYLPLLYLPQRLTFYAVNVQLHCGLPLALDDEHASSLLCPPSVLHPGHTAGL